jgi:hypothetical protein
MLVDANILLYAVDSRSAWHAAASSWLSEQLNGNRRVGLPWQSLVAFLRIATHPRASRNPLTSHEAWAYVADWLLAEVSWIPTPTPQHADVLAGLITGYELRGNLVPDAELAALAIEHGLVVCSADSDFARFGEVTWRNPLA